MAIHKDIKKLIDADVIDQQTADRIRSFYDSKQSKSPNLLLTIFAVVGSFLVGLGIILILAHNWDQLPRWTKTVIAFIPLIAGQALCWYSYYAKNDNAGWMQGSAVFLTLAVGASIALVSQIYNLDGSMQGFLMLWMLLTIPIIYLMNASVVSILYILGTAYYGGLCADRGDDWFDISTYLLLLGAIIPYYLYLIKNRLTDNATGWHHWAIPISLLYGTAITAFENVTYVLITYMSLLGIYYMIGHLPFMKSQSLRRNGYLIIGALGTVSLLLFTSFHSYWKGFLFKDPTYSVSFISSVVLFVIASGLLAFHITKGTFDKITPVMPVFIVFLVIFTIGQSHPSIAQLLINILTFAIAILTIKAGVERDHLGILNYGLLIISALLACRFFDTNLSFVLRGVLFILVGLAFFMTNSYLIKKREQHAR